jgi:hypothetical protein
MSGLHEVPPDQPINRQGAGRRRIGPAALLSHKNATAAPRHRHVVGPGSALSTTSWWHCQQDAAVDTHVAQRHRLDSFVEARPAKKSPARVRGRNVHSGRFSKLPPPALQVYRRRGDTGGAAMAFNEPHAAGAHVAEGHRRASLDRGVLMPSEDTA